MTELQKMYERKGEIIHQMRDMLAQAASEKRGLSADEDEKYKRAETDLDALSSTIQRAEDLKTLSSEYEAQMSTATASTQQTRDAFTQKTVTGTAPETKKGPDYRQIWTTAMGTRFGMDDLPTEHRQLLRRGYIETPELRGTDPQVSSTAAAGGYLSPEEWGNYVIESMKAYGGMLQACTVMNTKSGDTLHLPTENVTSQLGDIIGQGVADDISDTTWGELTWLAYTYTSKIILIANELYAEEDAYNILQRVGNICASRIGRKQNLDLTTGAGTTEPRGITIDAALGKTGASATAVTRSELLDLIHSVDPAYRIGPKVGFMFNDATLAAIRKLSIGSGDDRPLWVPSMREGAPSTIEGMPYWINQDMATMATTAKSILFGDFSKYIIRQVRGLTLSRSTERYFERRSVGYFATIRMDGRLSDTAAVKHFANA